MKPVLFTIDNLPLLGSFPVSSFGLSLLIAFFICTFVIWRISRVYDIDSELIIDQILLSLAAALIGARLYFIAFHLSLIDSPGKIFLFSLYPGLSFWGAFIGGFLALWLINAKNKLNFWQIADYLTPALFLALSIISLGCLLGSCQYGLKAPTPFGITQIGVVGKRFPLQIIEGLIYFSAFFFFWKSVLKFHMPSQIASKGLILLGFIKIVFEPFRGDSGITSGFKLGYFWSLIIISYGIVIYYKNIANPNRNPITDFKYFIRILTNSSKRSQLVTKIKKECYNALVDLSIFSARLRKNILKLINVKSNPDKF